MSDSSIENNSKNSGGSDENTDQSKSRKHTTMISSYDREELQNKMEKIANHSTSYFFLLCGLIAYKIFGKMQKLANQKYVQSVIHGEPADLATVDLFSNLVSAIAPLFGLLLDNIYPFRRRFSLYVIFAATIIFTSLSCVWAFPQSKTSFIAAISVHASADTFIAVVTQGVIAMKTKMDLEVYDLNKLIESMKTPEELEREKSETKNDRSRRRFATPRDQIGLRLYTFYTVFKAFFEGISSIIGGLIVQYVSIKLVYLIAATPGLFLILVIYLIKEPKEDTMYANNQNLMQTTKSFFTVFFAPMVILPAILKLLTKAIPDPGDAINFILVNQGGWSYAQLGGLNAMAVPIVAYTVNKLSSLTKGSGFEFLFMIGILSFGWSQLFEIPLIFTSIPFILFFISYIFLIVLNFAADLLTITSLFGRFNTLIPDGFESTGANILNSLIELADAVSLYGTKRELDYFGVVNGYYSRIKGPLIINYALSIITCFICPFFLLGGSRSQPKKN